MSKLGSVYLLGGIAFVSELPLPELSACEEEPTAVGFHTVHIRLGAVPFSLPGGVEVDSDCLATSAEYVLRVPGIANYRVAHGAEVVVAPETGALEMDVRAYLLGTIFAVLCHQRGLLPMHASAVSSSSGVTAFLARSGEGKSSLVANLARRGFPVVADDICLVDTERDGVVIPTAPWMKLWRTSLLQLGLSPEGLGQVFSEDDKYRLPLDCAAARAVSELQPLRRIIFLESHPGGNGAAGKLQIKEMSRVHALPLLMNLIHQAYLVNAIGRQAESFRLCGQVLSNARAYRLVRPWGFDYMEETIDAIAGILRKD